MTVRVRYLVDDVDAAVRFYTASLGFAVEARPAPGFAVLGKDGVTLLVNATSGPGGAAQPMPDGRVPEPGGWNRLQVVVDDLAATVEALRAQGVRFRNDVVTGRGGAQVLVEDPAGNPVELFQPYAGS